MIGKRLRAAGALLLALSGVLAGCASQNESSRRQRSEESSGLVIFTDEPTTKKSKKDKQDNSEEGTETTTKKSKKNKQEYSQEETEPTTKKSKKNKQESSQEGTEPTTKKNKKNKKSKQEYSQEETEAPTEEYPGWDSYDSENYVEYHFRNQKLLDQHFTKHGGEFAEDFGYQNAEEYEKGASDVINNPDALYKLEAEDGDGVYYIEETNEFVVLSTDGYIRTYFRPDSGKKYFDKQ